MKALAIPNTAMAVTVDVGEYNSTQTLFPDTNGWGTFSYTMESNQAGHYYLSCKVSDDDDLRLNSYLAVDGLKI